MTDSDPSANHGRATATVDSLLRASPLPALEARILLGYVLGWRRTELITRSDEILPADPVAHYQSLEARRAAGEPVAQLTRMREFFGREFEVTPDVLIPRPETELLVETALSALDGIARPRVLDLGTGTGAIAVSIAAERPDADVIASDRSPLALAVAARNAARLLGATRPGGPLRCIEGSWYDALGAGAGAGAATAATAATPTPTPRFHAIVSNPPYIARHDPHLDEGDLRFEPRGALTDEADGLDAIRAIVAGASHWLLADGVLWLEHGYDQAAAVRALLQAAGFSDVESLRDLAGIERISGGVWRV